MSETALRPADILRITPSSHRLALPPDWRWQRAKWLLSQPPSATRRQEDVWTKLAVRFLRLYHKAESLNAMERLANRMPGIYWAYDYYQRGERECDTRWLIEAYLCGETPLTLIADRTRQHNDTVLCYANLFFDIVGKTQHWGYMIAEVIKRSISEGLFSRDYDLLWKLYGFLKGHHMVDAAVLGDSDQGRLTEPSQVRAAQQGLLRDSLTSKAVIVAQTHPTDYGQKVIFEAYTKMIEIERLSDDAGKSQTLIVNNIQAVMSAIQFRPSSEREAPRLLGYDPKYANAPADLRAHEKLAMAMGQKVDVNLDDFKFPEHKSRPPGERPSK